MILSCPACSARFVLDPRAIGASGRVVRCGKCKHEWRATAPLITMEAGDIQSAPGRLRPVPPGSSLPVMTKNGAPPVWRSAGFAAAAALLIAMPFLAMKLSPWFSGPAVAAKVEKKEFVALDGAPITKLRQEEGRPVVDIQGALLNRSEAQQKVPTLKASAVDAKGGVVREWTIPLTATQLEPGQRLPFSFSAPLPDRGVEDIAFHLL